MEKITGMEKNQLKKGEWVVLSDFRLTLDCTTATFMSYYLKIKTHKT